MLDEDGLEGSTDHAGLVGDEHAEASGVRRHVCVEGEPSPLQLRRTVIPRKDVNISAIELNRADLPRVLQFSEVSQVLVLLLLRRQLTL